jgi:hypothetical protein
MVFKKSILIALLFLCLARLNAFAQDKPKNIKFTRQKDVLFITYDLAQGGSDNFYTVDLTVVDSVTHSIIVAKSAKGDIGKAVKGGEHRQIEWEYLKDSVQLSTRFSVVLTAERHTAGGGPANALRSVIVPGWGDYYVYKKKGNPAWIITAVSYGCVGYGVYNMMQATKNYNSYHSAVEQSDLDNYYNKAVAQQNTGSMFITIGAAVWAADVVNVLIKGMSNSGYKHSHKQTSNLNWNLNIYNNAPGLNLTYKF